MPLTRAQEREILEYLLTEVLRLDDPDDPIRKLFRVLGITTLTDFISTDGRDFANEVFDDIGEDGEVGQRNLGRAQSRRCELLRNMSSVIITEEGSVPDLNGWRAAVTPETFLIFTANPRQPVPDAGMAPIVQPPAASATSQAAVFLRGNKRDISAYPELKDILKFTTWKMQFDALAIKDNVAKVIDANYVPTPNSPEADVFRAQQDFVYAVFTSTLKDPTAKNILASEMRTRNAQKIYRELVRVATTSAQAKIAKSELVAFLTTKTLDNSWRGTHDGFLLQYRATNIRIDCHKNEPQKHFFC